MLVTYMKKDTTDAGDLGRRIVERQRELNLSVAQLAERAGMAANYLEYLEQTPTAEPSSSTLLRLALALDMDSSDLLGGQQGRAHGRTKAATDPHLVKLDDAECGDLLRGGGIGRVVFRASGRPVAIPVNYKMLKENVVFRSAGDGEISGLGPEEPVSFEVDCIDDAHERRVERARDGHHPSGPNTCPAPRSRGVRHRTVGGRRAKYLLLPPRHRTYGQKDQCSPMSARGIAEEDPHFDGAQYSLCGW